jgi:hypothetical protein
MDTNGDEIVDAKDLQVTFDRIGKFGNGWVLFLSLSLMDIAFRTTDLSRATHKDVG